MKELFKMNFENPCNISIHDSAADPTFLDVRNLQSTLAVEFLPNQAIFRNISVDEPVFLSIFQGTCADISKYDRVVKIPFHVETGNVIFGDLEDIHYGEFPIECGLYQLVQGQRILNNILYIDFYFAISNMTNEGGAVLRDVRGLKLWEKLK